jgi:dihydroneopterin aldolase
MEKLSERYFDSTMSAREHAIFEVGIKLAALYHIMIGIPIRNDRKITKKLTDGIVASISCQPFVHKVEITIKEISGPMGQKFDKETEFDYTYVSGRNLEATVEVLYDNWIAIGRVEWISDLAYPLMYIRELKEISPIDKPEKSSKND